MKKALITTLLSISLVAGHTSTAAAQGQVHPTLLQRIRELLGLVQPVEAGGTRGDSRAVSVCLISPMVTQPGNIAIVPISRPTIRKIGRAHV